MSVGTVVLAVDVGTTSAKTCLYRIGGTGAGEGGRGVALVAAAQEEYALRALPDGGMEQDPEDWWRAICAGVRAALGSAGLEPGSVAGMALCSQMQGLVLVDAEGRAVRPAMSYMDSRAGEQKKRGIGGGLVRIAGMDALKLIPSLVISGGVSASAKDPVWKYGWVREREPEAFARVDKWLDVKEYVVRRCTGRSAMTPDSANATFLYDTRPGRRRWSPTLCALFGVNRAHLPEVVEPTEEVGGLLPGPAAELGLAPGTRVFGGGGDLSLIALGAGAVRPGDAHVYMGTSGWVSAVVDRRIVDTDAFIASVMGAAPGRYNYISEQETSGKCMEWVRDHLALDEIGVYLGRTTVAEDADSRYGSLFELLSETVGTVAPGSGGAIFTPWLHGNRSPFEDPDARGMFFNIGLGTGKRALIRSVVEGIAFHNRWQLESIEKRTRVGGALRFAGGGARSSAIARILADVLGRTVETVKAPQNSGALGAALVCACGLGLVPSLDDARELVPVDAAYEPDERNAALYDGMFPVFKSLYYNNRRAFAALNSAG